MKLGDTVKKLTDALGIPQCPACAERQHWLNQLGTDLSALLPKGDHNEEHKSDKP